MGGMPYVFEQGTIASVMDDYLADERRAVETLRGLRPQADGTLLPVTAGGLDAAVLQSIPNPVRPGETMTAAEHLRQHWFGHNPDGSAGTAWWRGWRGNAEDIMRWT